MQTFDRQFYNGRQDFVLFNKGVVVQQATYYDRYAGRKAANHSGIVAGDRYTPNNWAYGIYEHEPAQGIVEVISGKFKTVRQGFVAGVFSKNSPLILPTTVPDHLYNAALSRLNEKVRGSIDLSVDIVQAASTARMFKAANKVVQLAQIAQLRPKAIGAAWLELQYGWKPLLGTIYDTVDKIHDVIISDYRRVRGRASESVPTGEKISETVEEYGTLKGLVNRKGKYTCEIGLLIKTSLDDSAAAYSSLNPISIAWELVPFSFVVDWFIDIGGYLRNMETSLLYSNAFVTGYRSDGCWFDATWESHQSPTSFGWHSVSSSLKQRSFIRTKLTQYPVPRLPSFRADLGSTRLLNAAALLSQALRR
jgi:hypothetical protein